MPRNDPTSQPEDAVAALAADDSAIQFPSFTHSDARAVGNRITALAEEQSLAVTTAIWLGEQRVFHSAMAGTSADNDSWVERKAALVRRYDASSWLATTRLRRYGIEVATLAGGLDPLRYVLAGGAVPIRIQGTLVGVVAVSGLSDAEDHELAVDALRWRLESRGATRGTGAEAEPG